MSGGEYKYSRNITVGSTKRSELWDGGGYIKGQQDKLISSQMPDYIKKTKKIAVLEI